MWQIARSKKSETSTSDIFIINLAILDAYFCLMSPIDMVNRMVLASDGVWFFQRFAYGVKDTAPLFLVSRNSKRVGRVEGGMEGGRGEEIGRAHV